MLPRPLEPKKAATPGIRDTSAPSVESGPPAQKCSCQCRAVRSEYIHTFFSAIRPLKLSEESSASQLSGAIPFNMLMAVVTHCSSTEVLDS